MKEKKYSVCIVCTVCTVCTVCSLRALFKMADGSDREVTQADQNDINSQWSLFFTDLNELLSEYEQHRSTNDIME